MGEKYSQVMLFYVNCLNRTLDWYLVYDCQYLNFFHTEGVRKGKTYNTVYVNQEWDMWGRKWQSVELLTDKLIIWCFYPRSLKLHSHDWDWLCANEIDKYTLLQDIVPSKHKLIYSQIGVHLGIKGPRQFKSSLER